MPQKSHLSYSLIVLARRLLAILILLSFVVPSPLAAQSSVAAPSFSLPHGLYNTPFSLTLSSATPGAQIYYTLDYRTPTANSTLYTGPIAIAGTTIVRAIAIAGATKSATVTQSYLFLSQVRTQARGNFNNDPNPNLPNPLGPNWPRSFFKADADATTPNVPYLADYEMDPIVVDYYPSSQFEQALKSIPTISLVTDQANLWDPAIGMYYNPLEKGASWERPASIEWIDPNGTSLGFSENVGIRQHGQASRRPRSTPKKNIRVYFKAAYGSPKLNFKLFDESDAVAEFDRILLRNGGNSTWSWWNSGKRRLADYVNDQWTRSAWGEMGRLTSHGTYAHLYINGLYWGLYNVTERIDEKFTASYLGGTDTDFDIVFADEDLNYQIVADVGDLVVYNKLVTLIDGAANVSAASAVANLNLADAQDIEDLATYEREIGPLNQAVAAADISDATYQQIQQLLDVEDLADYLILNHYVGKTDWPKHNWNAYRKRSGPDTRFKFIAWDNDGAMDSLSENNTKLDWPGSPAHMFLRLTTNAEFRQLLADRLYKFLYHDGVLSPKQCAARYSKLTSTIDQAVIGESARWGDYSLDVYTWKGDAASKPAYIYSRDLDPVTADPGGVVPDSSQKTWLQVRADKLSSYCPNRTNTLKSQYISNGWFSEALLPPTFSQEGGAVPANYSLALNLQNGGEIFYTTDGSDPRAFGGALAASAISGGAGSNTTISQVTTVKARVRTGSTWSPLHEATFYPPQSLQNLVINEIHYHPTAPANVDGDVYEFIELYNAGSALLRLDNLTFARGLTYRFPLNTSLASGAYLVLASDATKFQERYGVAPFGVYRGGLSNNGEAIQLADAVGNLLDLVNYTDTAPWPTAPDGTGPSLALCNPSLDNASAASWSASSNANGTPGQANALPCGGGGNQSPTVSITSPANGASFNAGSTVQVTANAADADGNVINVRFLVDGATIAGCENVAAPYQCSVTPSLGVHSFTAIATDNLNANTTSAPVAITVVPVANQLPSATISNPGVGASLLRNTAVLVNVNASDADGLISKVVITVNGTQLCEVISAPFQCSWIPTTLGPAILHATATDNAGASVNASDVSVTVVDLPSGVFQEVNGMVVMEAEHFSSKTQPSLHDWQDQTGPSGTSGMALSAQPNVGYSLTSKNGLASFSPELRYQVQLASKAKYYVWVRVWAASKNDDSLHIGLDGAAKTTLSAPRGVNWSWVKVSLSVSAPGLHNLNLWMREDGLYIDKLVLTSLKSYKPTGVGPNESRRGASVVAATTDTTTNTTTGGIADDEVDASIQTAQELSVTLSDLAQHATIATGTTITLKAEATHLGESETQVLFFVNGEAISSCDATSAPYECSWTPSAGEHTVVAVAYSDQEEISSQSVVVTVTEQESGLPHSLFVPFAKR